MCSHCMAEILRAARILRQMEKAHAEQRGAAGLTTEDGSMEMIDAPMILQVRLIRGGGLRKACTDTCAG